MNLKDASKLTESEAREFMESIRWPYGPECAHCGSRNVVALMGKSTRPGVKKCRDCRKQFTVTVNTIFERSHIPLRIWLMALTLMCQSKKGVSALQVKRQLGLGSYETAWHLCHRIRHAMDEGPLKSLLSGVVESDETYVGGKPRRGGPKRKPGRGTDKAPVMALVEREGKLRAHVLPTVNAANLRRVIDAEVDKSDSALLTDDLGSYVPVGKEFAHGHHTVNHSANEFSRGGIHVNSAESYFALLKRGIHGSFHHVSKEHLHRYCKEFEFRWNTRKQSDADRFIAALLSCPGKRLVYAESVKKKRK